jgi:hypothetical protein
MRLISAYAGRPFRLEVALENELMRIRSNVWQANRRRRRSVSHFPDRTTTATVMGRNNNYSTVLLDALT